MGIKNQFQRALRASAGHVGLRGLPAARLAAGLAGLLVPFVMAPAALAAATPSGATTAPVTAPATTPPTIPDPAHTLTVSAAVSLTDAMKEIAAEYERRYPGSTVLLNFGGSGSLLQQIEKGAPVDVFASADDATMDRAQKWDRILPETRKVFASNTLVVIQPASVPSRPLPAIRALTDLQNHDFQRIAIGNPDSVPAGRYARAALQEAALWEALQPKLIPTQNVRQALEYVARGEVDAGFVYGSDAARVQDKVTVALTVPLKATYPVAVVRNSSRQDQAARYVDLIVSPYGQEVLSRYGFMPATP